MKQPRRSLHFAAISACTDFHERHAQWGRYQVAGLGYSNPRPSIRRGEYSETELATELEPFAAPRAVGAHLPLPAARHGARPDPPRVACRIDRRARFPGARTARAFLLGISTRRRSRTVIGKTQAINVGNRAGCWILTDRRGSASIPEINPAAAICRARPHNAEKSGSRRRMQNIFVNEEVAGGGPALPGQICQAASAIISGVGRARAPPPESPAALLWR